MTGFCARFFGCDETVMSPPSLSTLRKRIISRDCTCQTHGCILVTSVVVFSSSLVITLVLTIFALLCLSGTRVVCKHNIAPYYAFLLLNTDHAVPTRFPAGIQHPAAHVPRMLSVPPPKRWEEVLAQMKRAPPLTRVRSSLVNPIKLKAVDLCNASG